jgi:hypothetical protein
LHQTREVVTLGQLLDIAAEKVASERPDLLLVDVSNDHVEGGIPWTSASYTIAVGPRRLHKEMSAALNACVFLQKLSHRKLGGLTQATVLIFWSGENGHEVHLRRNDYPVQPVDKFFGAYGRFTCVENESINKRESGVVDFKFKGAVPLATTNLASDSESSICILERQRSVKVSYRKGSVPTLGYSWDLVGTTRAKRLGLE